MNKSESRKTLMIIIAAYDMQFLAIYLKIEIKLSMIALQIKSVFYSRFITGYQVLKTFHVFAIIQLSSPS